MQGARCALIARIQREHIPLETGMQLSMALNKFKQQNLQEQTLGSRCERHLVSIQPTTLGFAPSCICH